MIKLIAFITRSGKDLISDDTQMTLFTAIVMHLL